MFELQPMMRNQWMSFIMVFSADHRADARVRAGPNAVR
jgi:hypothetical protein